LVTNKTRATLTVVIVAADDVERERRDALHVIADLDRSNDRLDLRPAIDPDPDNPAELALVIVGGETDDAFVAALAAAANAERTWLFTDTAPVAVDLGDRAAVLEKLERRTALDTLLDSHAGRWQRTIAFAGAAGFAPALERELKGFLATRLGLGHPAVSLRPQGADSYLARPRLLQRLPDAPGHVVWLEAPYGYGKSVLAAQWADTLERDGWRVAWPAPSGGDLRAVVAAALGATAELPDPLLRDRLWETPTLLVIEDLDDGSDLAWLLDDVRGLVLLASRDALADAQLHERLAQGSATHLGATDLAFSVAEAEVLVGDRGRAAELHAATLGWTLPLHVANLTGAAPDAASLLVGIRAGVDATGWHEVLLLAALPHLPQAAATAATEALAARGLVQRLEGSLRLHPYLSDIVLAAYSNEVREAVRADQQRLPLLLRGAAYERSRDLDRLAQVLEAADAEPWREAPTQLVAWDALLPAEPSARRDWTVGAAFGRLHDFPAAITRLERALIDDDLTVEERLGILRELCLPLAVQGGDGQALIEGAEPLLDRADPEVAGRFLGNTAVIHAHADRYEAAIESVRRALDYLPKSSPHRLASEINEALFRYDLYGDFDHRLRTQVALLERTEATYPVQALGQCRDLGMMHWWLGDVTAASSYLERARDGERINPAIGVEARAALAYLDADADALDDALREARLFDNPYLGDIATMYAVEMAREAGDLELARQRYEQTPDGPFATSAYARALAAGGERDEALALIDRFADLSDRATRLYLDAARYRITRDEADLDAFLAVTTAGIRLLPGFVPLDALPERPELAAHYPIAEVLASGRPDAVRLRQGDIPPLELELLGEVTVTLLGDTPSLAERQKQLLVLLSLGLSREAAAEALWPEVDAKKQRNNLHVQLNGLRKVLEPWRVTTYLGDDGLQRFRSDHTDLVGALDAADPERAFVLYRGPFAPTIDLEPIADERGRLHDDVGELLVSAGRDAVTDPDDAVRYLQRALELEPLHEDALQALLKLLLRRGRRREARRRYAAFVETLQSELGLEPLEATRTLIER
jgi:DNA-binding SARP family transcriptional activator